MNSSIEQTARAFFEACEGGEGWLVCSRYCKPDASFAAQAEALADVRTLEAYTDWMKGLYTFMPDAGYDLKSWGVDAERNNVCAYAVFFGTHTGEGGPCPPTGKSVRSDYVYVMSFEGDKNRSPDEDLEFWVHVDGDWLAVAADDGRSPMSDWENWVLLYGPSGTLFTSRLKLTLQPVSEPPGDAKF